ncbi:MAG: TorD/DmsD family molecular chaperone [Pseudomonadota bacterium]
MDELGILAEERSQVYWLLSRFFLAPPDAEFLAELDAGLQAVSYEEADALDTALMELQCGLATTSLLELQAEHLRLFGGVREGYGPPPPYESLHREGRLLGQSIESVMRHYRISGFSLANEIVGPEDHLGLELKFLALLCHEESRRWRDGNAAAGRAALAAQHAFIEKHLHAWAPAYCRHIQGESHHPFFRAVTGLTAASIEQDARQVSALLSELSATGMNPDCPLDRADTP